MLFIPKSVKKRRKKKKRLAHKRPTVLTNTSTQRPLHRYTVYYCVLRHGLVSVDGRVKSETRIERAGVRK